MIALAHIYTEQQIEQTHAGRTVQQLDASNRQHLTTEAQLPTTMTAAAGPMQLGAPLRCMEVRGERHGVKEDAQVNWCVVFPEEGGGV
jgi:hypothetical protein